MKLELLYWCMFHAGAVAASSDRLLQLLTFGAETFGPLPLLRLDRVDSENLEGLSRPAALGVLVDAAELVVLVLLTPLGRVYDELNPPYPPVF